MTPGGAGLLPVSPLEAGSAVGGYRIERPLMRGADNIAYAAQEAATGRTVRMLEYLPAEGVRRSEDGKTLEPRDDRVRSRLDAALGRIGRFAAAWEGLAHPAIVRVLDFLRADGTGYLVTAPYEGKRLATLAGEADRLDAEEIDEILPPVLDALERLHAMGLVHGDIRPGSIVVGADGSVALGRDRLDIDWLRTRADAIAARIDDPYIAEEFFLPDAAFGPPTDLYGLSATLFRLVTGAPPADVVRRIRETAQGGPDPIIAPLAVAQGRDARLVASIVAGLAVVAEDRPQTVAAFRAGLALPAAARATPDAPDRAGPSADLPRPGEAAEASPAAHGAAGIGPPPLDVPTRPARRRPVSEPSVSGPSVSEPRVSEGGGQAPLGATAGAARSAPTLPPPAVLPPVAPQTPVGPALPAVDAGDVPPTPRLPETRPSERAASDAADDATGTSEAAAPAPCPTPPAPLAFTIFHPRTLPHRDWRTLEAYVHEPDGDKAVGADRAGRLSGRFREQAAPLADTLPSVVPPGAPVTVLPAIPGCRVNPPAVTLFRHETLHRVEFRVAVSDEAPAPDGGAPPLAGRVGFLSAGRLVGEVAFGIRRDEDEATDPRHRTVPARARGWTGLYLCRAPDDPWFPMGDDGPPQGAGDLRREIEAAELFQLCWSPNAVGDPTVAEALAIATGLGRPDFLRVVMVPDADGQLPAGLPPMPVYRLPVR